MLSFHLSRWIFFFKFYSPLLLFSLSVSALDFPIRQIQGLRCEKAWISIAKSLVLAIPGNVQTNWEDLGACTIPYCS